MLASASVRAEPVLTAHRGTGSSNGWGSRWRHVTEIQRSRLLSAAVRAVEEVGYQSTTVVQITSRARVSRRTFYELFANRDACLAAVLDDVADRVGAMLTNLDLEALSWQERVRTGLWAILSFFEDRPELARLCVIHAARGGPELVERREQILARLVELVDEGRPDNGHGESTPLVAEGLVGAAVRIVHKRLLSDHPEPVTELLGELMGIIVSPYQGLAAARREQLRPPPGRLEASPRRIEKSEDPLDGIPIRLTYRTARVLEGIAAHPGASNRMVADHAGIADQGQASKLLARLERLGLIRNCGEGRTKWQLNAWMLTPRGLGVVERTKPHSAHEIRGNGSIRAAVG